MRRIIFVSGMHSPRAKLNVARRRRRMIGMTTVVDVTAFLLSLIHRSHVSRLLWNAATRSQNSPRSLIEHEQQMMAGAGVVSVPDAHLPRSSPTSQRAGAVASGTTASTPWLCVRRERVIFACR